MSTTIKDIAKISGVSIATVSHVINHTRYVSPEVVTRVEAAIEGTDYKQKIEKKTRKLLRGNRSGIAIVIPSIVGTLYAALIKNISSRLLEDGYLVSTFLTNDDYEVEQKLLNRLAGEKAIAGVILSPCHMNEKDYESFMNYNIPTVFLERRVIGYEADCILADNEVALHQATRHLIRSGHEKIGILLGDMQHSTVLERLNGYKKALSEADIPFSEEFVLSISHEIERQDSSQSEIQKFCLEQRPTAVISCGNQLTYILLRAMQSIGMECPQDLSIIGFGDAEWCELIVPPMTVIKQNPERMAELAVNRIIDKIMKKDITKKEARVPLDLIVRESTQMIGRGPFGERAFSPDDLVLTEEEKQQLRDGDFKVAISFHYSGTAWKTLHEEGIKQTLDKYGITVLSVTDAHFDPYLQVTQLEGIGMQQPDAVIAIPADDTITADTFKKLSQKTKLIFLSNVPKGFCTADYVSCVSVNERENGHAVGYLMGDYFADKGQTQVGFINHGRPFYGTHLRDMIALQTVCENYRNIEVKSVKEFQNIDDTYRICKRMVEENPKIKGLYVSWDRPALQAIQALEELGREDIAIFTFDLDEEIGTYLAQDKIVKGMSTQRPFEQGVAAAMAVANALLGKKDFKYIGVPPYTIQRTNMLRSWKKIMHEPAPKSIEQYLE